MKIILFLKGMNNLTEMYSAMKAEVVVEDDVRTMFNVALMEKFKACNKVNQTLYVATIIK